MSLVSPVASPVVLNFSTGVLRARALTTVTDPLQNLRQSAATSAASSTRSATTIATACNNLGKVAEAFREAYTQFNRRFQSVRSVQWFQHSEGESRAASASRLATTHRVNEQGSATQSSTSALGLILDPNRAVARLASTQAIGLNDDPTEQSSVLDGTTALNLDLESPESPSTLTSSRNLALDVASPGAKSALTSTEELNTGTENDEPISVDPDALFDHEDPGLRPRFDNDAQVAPGSFSINGTSIDVLAGDSLNAVLTRINNANAGVTATFQNDRVTLESTEDSEDDILLADDTSGLLAALKLTDATTVKGNVADDQQILAKTSQFAGIASGSFTVNGVTVELDRDADTLQSLITKINNSGAQVTASYNADDDKFTLTTADATESAIPIGDDTTGILEALGLNDGISVLGNVPDNRLSLTDLPAFSSVTSGSFKINNVEIEVHPSVETLQDLLTRITDSEAGATATYHAESGGVRLTSKANSEADITVSDDSSGFLAAAGLDTSNTVRGAVPDDQETFATSTAFSAVTSGSFTVNGTTITVDRDADSLQTILDRINSAGAGVTASYDANTDRLQLSQDGEDDIVLADDSTGLLAALGLDNAETEHIPGRDDERTLALTETFASVSAGSFSINGTAINLDPAADSLVAILARINESEAGVTASYDENNDQVVLTSNSGEPLTLSDDTTGFLSAAHLPLGPSGPQLNVDAAFNGSGGDPPGFEDGFSVTTGSFEVNGVTIEVAEDDSVAAVLARITDSAAGVTAAFDADTQRVTLTAKETGATSITLGNDTSGLLAALKLDETAESTTGEDALVPRTVWTHVETDTGRRALNDPAQAASELATVFNRLNNALDQVRDAGKTSPLFRSDVERVLNTSLGSISNASTRGLSLSSTTNSLRLNLDLNQLTAALASEPKVLQAFFRGSDNLPDGLESLVANYTEQASAEPIATSTSSAFTTARQVVIGAATLADLNLASDQRELQLIASASQPTAAPVESKVRSAYGLS